MNNSVIPEPKEIPAPAPMPPMPSPPGPPKQPGEFLRENGAIFMIKNLIKRIACHW
jgi:hypothetical protein